MLLGLFFRMVLSDKRLRKISRFTSAVKRLGRSLTFYHTFNVAIYIPHFNLKLFIEYVYIKDIFHDMRLKLLYKGLTHIFINLLRYSKFCNLSF